MDVPTSCGDVDNYMASVQALSTLADSDSVTSFPLSAETPAQFQYMTPTTGCYDLPGQSQSAIYGQDTGHGLPTYWQHDGLAQPRWNVNGYASATVDRHDWTKYQPYHHTQQYVNGYGRHAESSVWHHGRYARYHPYATAAAGATTTAGYRMDSVGVGVAPRAPVYGAPVYSNSLGDASHNCIRQVAFNGRQQSYVPYQTPQADYVSSSYSDYQISSPYNQLNDFGSSY